MVEGQVVEPARTRLLGGARWGELPPGGGVESIPVPVGMGMQQFADAKLDRALEIGRIMLCGIDCRSLAPSAGFNAGQLLDELRTQRGTPLCSFVLLVRATLRTQMRARALVPQPFPEPEGLEQRRLLISTES